MGTEEMIIKWYTPTLFSKELKAKKGKKGSVSDNSVNRQKRK